MCTKKKWNVITFNIKEHKQNNLQYKLSLRNLASSCLKAVSWAMLKCNVPRIFGRELKNFQVDCKIEELIVSILIYTMKLLTTYKSWGIKKNRNTLF